MELFFEPTVIIAIACILGFFTAWGIGANDVANAMGTSVGSKALTLKQAVIIAAIFEFLGAFLAGGGVTDTIRKEIVDPNIYQDNVNIFIIGMMSTLLAAGSWLYIASRKGWPVSTTHSIVGAIIGFVWVTKGGDAISWDKVTEIGSSWITSPILSGVIAFLIFFSIKKLIFDSDKRSTMAIRLIPVYVTILLFVILQVTFQKGLKYVEVDLTDVQSLYISVFGSIFLGIISFFYLRIKQEIINSRGGIEVAFSLLMVVAACAMAFAHGSNDVANAIGPLAAIVSAVGDGGLGAESKLNIWILLLGGIGIVFGLATYGHKVIKTVGKKITKLTPSFGFSANLATASTVVFASYLGLPISTTHTLIGGVIGVGLAHNAKKLNLKVILNIFMSWIITIPVGAAFTIMFYSLIRALLITFGVENV